MKFFNVALLLFAGAEAVKIAAFDAATTAATDSTAGATATDCPDCQVGGEGSGEGLEDTAAPPKLVGEPKIKTLKDGSTVEI